MKQAWEILKKSFQEFSCDNCMMSAAAISYYTVFAMPPLLVIIVSLAGTFVGPGDVRQQMSEEVTGVVGEGGAEQVATMLEHAQRPKRGLLGTLIGIVALVFGATGVMVHLQSALNQVWNVDQDQRSSGFMGFIFKRMLSVAMVLAVAFVVLASLVATMILRGMEESVDEWFAGQWVSELVTAFHWTLSWLTMTGLLSVMYRFLPDVRIAWRDLLPAAAITGGLFVIAKSLLGLYLAHSNVASTYGAVGALVLILMWVYYSGIIFLFGAELTRVWCDRPRATARIQSPSAARGMQTTA